MEEDKVIILRPNELPNLVGVSQLDDHNYIQWAQYVYTTLKGHKKLSHIKGSGPPRDGPKFESWDDEDFLIMTWLWNSMTLEISQNYMFHSSICEIWENLIETYSMKKDSTACYDIESKIFNSRQGTLLVTEYYGTLIELWIEIFKFLHGLNSEYDPIRFQILGKEKLPSLSDSEETRQSVMLDKGCSNTGFAMMIGSTSR
ncbi:hypothetical protein CR513_57975, partial [Mucuna pruriens]